MTEFPDTITTTPEHIGVVYGAAPDGGVSVALLVQCTPPVGTLRLKLAPGQPGAIYAALSQFINLTDDQYDQLAAAARKAQDEADNQNGDENR